MNFLDPIKNNSEVTVSIGYDASATAIALATGNLAKLPNIILDGASNGIWYNSTDYPNIMDDPYLEIVRRTANGGGADDIVITRAQEGTTATVKNIAGRVYKIAFGITKKAWDDIDTTLALFPLLAGKAGGQSINGGTASGERLRLIASSHATNGNVEVYSPNLGVTVVDTNGFSLINDTAAANNAQQRSPGICLFGKGWATTPLNSQDAEFLIYNLPVQGSTAPSCNLLIASSIAGAGYTTRFTLTSAGSLTIGAGFAATTGTFTAALTQSIFSLVDIPSNGLVIASSSASLVGIQSRISPRFMMYGRVWDTGAGADRYAKFYFDVVPTGGNPGTAVMNWGWNYGTSTTIGTDVPLIQLISSGNMGIGVTTPTGVLHLKAGTSTAGTAPIKLNSGTVLTVPEAGTIEFDGTDFYITI